MRSARSVLKAVAFTGLSNPFRIRRRLDRLRESRAITILNLHRVAPDDGSSYRPLAPALFEELLDFVTARFDLRTFATVAESADRPRMILSFDDAYRDFYEVAMPLLAERNIRVNQNVIPGCIERGEPPLNVLVQDFIGKAPPTLVRELRIEGYAGPRDHRFGHAASAYLKHLPMAEQQRHRATLLQQFARADGFEGARLMTLDQLREASTLHELGGHSFDHASMDVESDDYLAADVERCRDWFAEKLGSTMTIYAFPNGSARPGQEALVAAHGIDHVLMVGERFSGPGPICHRFTFDGHSRAEVRYRAVGVRAVPTAQPEHAA